MPDQPMNEETAAAGSKQQAAKSASAMGSNVFLLVEDFHSEECQGHSRHRWSHPKNITEYYNERVEEFPDGQRRLEGPVAGMHKAGPQ